MTNHSPTPWTKEKLYPLLNPGAFVLSYEQTEANVEFLIKAVNSHQMLIDALKSLEGVFKEDSPTRNMINEVLAKAEEK